jgi:hypothetical protein
VEATNLVSIRYKISEISGTSLSIFNLHLTASRRGLQRLFYRKYPGYRSSDSKTEELYIEDDYIKVEVDDGYIILSIRYEEDDGGVPIFEEACELEYKITNEEVNE